MAGWYRGNCHLHSVRSTGGELTPAQLTAAARAAGLDFVAVTEHNTTDGYADWVDHAGGLCVVAHPYAPYPSGTFEYPYQGFDAVEVWNGQWASDLPWNADNEAALADWTASLAADLHRGGWRPAIGNSDTHLAGQIGIPHTVVRAGERTVEALLAGIAAGHSWIAGSTPAEPRPPSRSRSVACRRAWSRSTPTGVRRTAPHCPPTAPAASDGAQMPRRRCSSGSRCATSMGGWRP
ncbi:PHP-associated domain-containing protein [Solwaraspora sp. WMMA2101]|uniref:PHP-associated domain-containing protein n=1 Tax=Solwaraspora sp. WMMA2101 TaxID=3404124 RepID=UPI003B933601